jgi:hypothetical protein
MSYYGQLAHALSNPSDLEGSRAPLMGSATRPHVRLDLPPLHQVI